MTIERLLEKAFYSKQIAMFAEVELDRIPKAVDGAIEIHPLATNFDIGLVHMPLRGHSALTQIKSLQQDGRISNNPTMNRRVIDADAPFGHHLFEVSQAQAVGEIPAHAKQDDGLIEMAAFEHWLSPKLGGG